MVTRLDKGDSPRTDAFSRRKMQSADDTSVCDLKDTMYREHIHANLTKETDRDVGRICGP